MTNGAGRSTTHYLGDALDALHAASHPVADEEAADLTPAQHDHTNFYCTYSFELETGLRRGGRRPLRAPSRLS